jgi:hypothetical protein
MSLRTSRFVALGALASSLALALPARADNTTKIYDAVNAYEARVIRDQTGNYRGFTITGIPRGASAEETATYYFWDATTGDSFYPTCERLALMAMKDAGKYALILTTQPSSGNTQGVGLYSCRLERR